MVFSPTTPCVRAPPRAQPSSSRTRNAAELDGVYTLTHIQRRRDREDEAAVKAEAMAIVAQAKKDIKLREEARGEMKKASRKTTSKRRSTKD